jgi:hypothetical protein
MELRKIVHILAFMNNLVILDVKAALIYNATGNIILYRSTM